MAKKPLPTPEELRQLVLYEPETGRLFWLPRPPSMFIAGSQSAERGAAIWNSQHAGREAFVTITNYGYLIGSLFKRMVVAHRVAWCLHYRRWPSMQIDHINGVRTDNRIANLRHVTNQDNCRNKVLSPTSSSGVHGVRRKGNSRKWVATITVNKQEITIGRFDALDDAILARRAAEREYGFHPNHGRRT